MRSPRVESMFNLNLDGLDFLKSLEKNRSFWNLHGTWKKLHEWHLSHQKLPFFQVQRR